MLCVCPSCISGYRISCYHENHSAQSGRESALLLRDGIASQYVAGLRNEHYSASVMDFLVSRTALWLRGRLQNDDMAGGMSGAA